jgi:hypothetical protein
MNKKEISAEIERVEKQLLELREKLNQPEHKKLSEVKIGDALEDGSIVVETYKNAVLVMAPKEADFCGPYEDDWERAFVKLGSLGFTLSDWFAPTAKIMILAAKNVPQAFAPWCNYWTTSKSVNPQSMQITVCSTSTPSPWGREPKSPYECAMGMRTMHVQQRLFRFIAF